MHSDDDLQTTLSKWPFILGDVLLVATALAIAILGQWQLTNWQVAACVISVALGAALFVLPYVVEYQVRVREAAEDRSADVRVLHRQLVGAQDELEAVSDRIEAIEGGLRNLAQAKPDLSGPLEALEKQIDPLREAKEAQSGQLAALSKQADALVKQVGTLEAALDSKNSGADDESRAQAEAIETLRTDLAALQSQVADVPAQIQAALAEAKPAAEAPADEPEPKKAREPRQRRSAEPRLLKRAIDQKRDHSSAAVSRIIETKNKKASESASEPAAQPEAQAPEENAAAEPEKGEGTKADLSEEKPAAPESEADESKGDEPKADEAKAQLSPEAEAPAGEPESPPEPEPESKPEAEEEPEAKLQPEVSEVLPDSEPEKKSEPEVKAAADKKVEEDPEPEEPETGETEDMFADAVPPQVSKRPRTKKSDTAVIASVFIGIGNKPYVRGSGAGLNWETGVAMEFEEIGKWRWLAPADLDGPVELQLYRNDEDPDTTGKYTLEPGRQLDLSPVF